VRKHLAKHPNDKQAKAALGRIMEAVVKRYE
jgi:ribosomal protein S15P/S13E